MIWSEPTSNGMARCTGARHPLRVTAARENPIRARKSRRVLSAFGDESERIRGRPDGNSPVTHGRLRNSSMLFQYVGAGGSPICTNLSLVFLQGGLPVRLSF